MSALRDEGKIVPVDAENIAQAAAIHSASWQASHRAFCSEAFIALHTPERQRAYIEEEMRNGFRLTGKANAIAENLSKLELRLDGNRPV